MLTTRNKALADSEPSDSVQARRLFPGICRFSAQMPPSERRPLGGGKQAKANHKGRERMARIVMHIVKQHSSAALREIGLPYQRVTWRNSASTVVQAIPFVDHSDVNKRKLLYLKLPDNEKAKCNCVVFPSG